MSFYTKLTVALVTGFCLMQAGQASAGTYTEYFADTPNSASYFPGYSDSYPESIGNNPDVTGILVSYNDVTGQLLSVTILSNTAVDTNGTWGFTSLFINTNSAGQDWNYLVHAGGNTGSSYVAGGAALPDNNGLYAVADNYTYTVVGSSNGREGHPDSIATDDLTYQGALTPDYTTNLSYDSSNGVSGTSNYALVYDFSSLNIILESDYTIGWTPFCANDVVYEEGKWDGPQQPPSAPEPATMVLFGAGMAALAGWHNRKKKDEK